MLKNSSTAFLHSIGAQQFTLLCSNRGLFDLYGKMPAKMLYSVAQQCVVVSQENITFGPDKYRVITPQSQDNLFQIIYYGLLYYIFQRKQDRFSVSVYSRLIAFVINNPLEFDHPQAVFTQQETKIYIIKFLNILASAKSKKKVVMEQLNNLPQIHFIFVELVKLMAKTRHILFNENVIDVQRNIKTELGIELNILSSQLILLGNQFQIQIRRSQQICQFSIFQDTQQNIDKIKNDYLLAQSAYFKEIIEKSQPKEEQRKGKVVKKSTITSIEWEGQAKQQEERVEDRQFYQNNSFSNDFPIFQPQQNQSSNCKFGHTLETSLKTPQDLALSLQRKQKPSHPSSRKDNEIRQLQTSYSVKCLKSNYFKQITSQQIIITQTNPSQDSQLNSKLIDSRIDDQKEVKSPLRLSTRSADLHTRVRDAVQKSIYAIKKWKQINKSKFII